MDFKDFKDKYQKVQVEQFPNKVQENIVVSVCVQTYQHAPYIKECLDGILMQETDFPFEVLLGEDASTDGTREICIEYAKKHPHKIKLFLHSRENNIKVGGEPTGRFNFLYNLYSARGNYIALCEGDDYWTDPLKLQKQVDFLEKNEDCSLCFHNAEVVFENSNKDKILFRELEDRNYSGEEVLRKWTIPTASVVFRKKYLDAKIYEHPDILYGDIMLFLKMAEHGKLKCFSESMSVYRRHEGGMMYKKRKNGLRFEKAIAHNKAILDLFGNKYRKVQDWNLFKLYLKLFRARFYEQNPRLFKPLLHSVRYALAYIFSK